MPLKYKLNFYSAILALTLAISVLPSHADSKSRSSILLEAAQAIGALGDAIGTITDGVKRLVVTSSDGVSFVLAKKTRSELIDLSAKSTQFTIMKNIFFVNSIEEYLHTQSNESWEDVIVSLTSVLKDGSAK